MSYDMWKLTVWREEIWAEEEGMKEKYGEDWKEEMEERELEGMLHNLMNE